MFRGIVLESIHRIGTNDGKQQSRVRGVHRSRKEGKSDPSRFLKKLGIFKEICKKSLFGKFFFSSPRTSKNQYLIFVFCVFFFCQNQEGPSKMVCTSSTKQYLISQVPPVLILHLKRFQTQRVGFRKVFKHVSFPVLLDLAPVCTNRKKPRLYALYGVVEHSGTVHGGHYVAYVKVNCIQILKF